ncbi:MAG: P27 family phage terminase small subunit [Oscillospiraceae bacterium]|nr:P27 family phage terminase small subunit [Oscillospiraceae bacterium]
MARPKSNKKIRAALRQDLIDQLERKGVSSEVYTDLVDDYMALYDAKTRFIQDIQGRGVKIEVRFANGELKECKTNDSVADLLKVNGQMLKILTTLGLDPASVGDNFPGDDDRL